MPWAEYYSFLWLCGHYLNFPFRKLFDRLRAGSEHMAKLPPAHRGQFVAIRATRNKAAPRVNAAGGSDEVKRAGGSVIFSRYLFHSAAIVTHP